MNVFALSNTLKIHDKTFLLLRVKLGDNDQYMPEEGEQAIEVEKYIIHPEFVDGIGKDYWMLNDIALIKVNITNDN